MGRIIGWLHDLASALFPRRCEACGCALVSGERIMCTGCLLKLPRTYTHRNPEGELARRLAAAGKIASVATWFRYKAGNEYSNLIRRSKYNGRPDIDRALGQMFASELIADGFFQGIDILMPVPIHYRKRAKRTFNQSEEIALGISAVTGIPVADNLIAERPHQSQTLRRGFDRRKVADNIYALRYPDELAGKHILIVDDVLTTGGTILACATAIRTRQPNVKISALTLTESTLT